MPGIRVQHPTARDVRYVVVEPTVPYPEPYVCTPPAMGGCGGTHQFKTHHLNLDATGAAIISRGVFERIKDRLRLDGFSAFEEVDKPPAIGIGLARDLPGAWGAIPILRSPTSVEPT